MGPRRKGGGREKGGIFDAKRVDEEHSGPSPTPGQGLFALVQQQKLAGPPTSDLLSPPKVSAAVSTEPSLHGTIYCHQDMLKANRFATALIYVPQDMRSSEVYGEIVAIKLSTEYEDRWIAGRKEVCLCHPKRNACEVYGLSPWLWNQLPPDKEWTVKSVVHKAETASRILQVSLQLQPEDPTMSLPLLRNALRLTAVAPGFTGEVIGLGGRVFKYRILRVVTEDGQNELGFVDMHSSFHITIVRQDAELASGADKDVTGLARIAGNAMIKDVLEKSLITPLSQPERYMDRMGNLRGMRPAKGVLLHGVPGTGKSFFCKAIEEEIKLRWMRKSTAASVATGVTCEVVSGSSIRTQFDLADVFDRARTRFLIDGQLTLLIIDEIDSLCPKRQDTTSDERIGIINTFLTHLDGSSSCVGTFIVATTNRPEALDEALRRPGRLDREIELLVPSPEDRLKVLLAILRRYGAHSEWMDERRDELEKIAMMASGFVPSDIDNWVRLAVEESDGDITPEVLRRTAKAIYPSALKELSIEVPKVSWHDIGGYDEVKALLRECVEWPMMYRKQFETLELKAPRGVLLYGPPGNSKTMMAKAVATESHMNFISIKGPELFSKYVGESEKKLRTVFKRARQYAPTIIFFDEIDSIAGDRAAAENSSGVEGRLLSQLLNEMDGIGIASEVIVLGATNRPDAIDSALMRPGRFDRLVYISLPDLAARAKIWSVYLPKLDADSHMKLAAMSEGYSGAEIHQICESAKMSVFRRYVSTNQPETDINQVSLIDVLNELAHSKPRTSQELIQYYEQFANKNS